MSRADDEITGGLCDNCDYFHFDTLRGSGKKRVCCNRRREHRVICDGKVAQCGSFREAVYEEPFDEGNPITGDEDVRGIDDVRMLSRPVGQQETGFAIKKFSNEDLETAGIVLDVFPLAALVVPDPRLKTGEDRFFRNYMASFQFSQLRAMYYLLVSRVRGFQLAFPIEMHPVDTDEFKGIDVIWVCQCDHMGLGQFNVSRVRTTWTVRTNGDKKTSTLPGEGKRELITFADDDGMNSFIGGDPVRLDGKLIRTILLAIKPQLFDEIFKVFFKSMNLYVPCTGLAHSHLDDDGKKTECKECNETGWVFEGKDWTDKFCPSVWLETCIGIYGWADGLPMNEWR